MTQSEFVNKLLGPAQKLERKSGVPALFTIAQAALESGWGVHAIGNNLFGIKANPSWTGKTKTVTTTEYFNDQNQGGKFAEVISITPENGRYKYVVKDSFRDYDSLQDCLEDHTKFLVENSRYAKAFKTSDPYLFADEVAKAGYATAPAYASTLKSVIDTVKRNAVTEAFNPFVALRNLPDKLKSFDTREWVIFGTSTAIIGIGLYFGIRYLIKKQ